MERNAFLLAVVLGVVVLAGCGKDEGYQKIYNTGHRDGYNEGLKRGEKIGYQTGFITAKPGADGPQHGGGLLGIATIISLLHVIGYLLFIKYKLITEQSECSGHTWGKSLAAAVAGLVILWMSTYLAHAMQSGVHILLSPAPAFLVGKLFIGCVTAVATYIFFFITIKLAYLHDNKIVVQAFLVFVLTLANAAFIKAAIYLFKVPDMSRYLASDLLFGALIGSVSFVAMQLLTIKAGTAPAWHMPENGFNGTDHATNGIHRPDFEIVED